jgi:hypothetical protein
MTHTSNFDPTISTYKITNYVLDKIDLTSSFNFLLQVLQHLTLIYKKGTTSKNYIPMIVKSRGRSGERTNPYKNYTSACRSSVSACRPANRCRPGHGNRAPSASKKREMVRRGQDHYSALAENTHYKGDMKWRRDILTLVSLYM